MNKIKLFLYTSLLINIILLVILIIAFSILYKQKLSLQHAQQPTIKKNTVKNTYTLNVLTTKTSISQKHAKEKFLNFSLNYPNTLSSSLSQKTINQTNPDYIGGISFYDKKSAEFWKKCGEKCLEGGPDYIEIAVYKNSDKISPTQWLTLNKDKDPYTNYDPTDVQCLEYFRINEMEAVKYLSNGLGGSDIVIIADSKNNLIYMFRNYFLNYTSKIRGDFWYILSSFKPLKDT